MMCRTSSFKLSIFLGYFLFVVSRLAAQQLSMDCWHRGAVQMKDGTIVQGLINYNIENDIIRFEVGGKEEFTFTANTINSFYFNDFIDSTERSFITYSYRVDDDYEIPMFFEYTLDGKIPLLSREYLTYGASGSMASAGFVGTGGKVVAHNFYYIGIDGEVYDLPEKRKKLALVFRGKQNEMKTYLKKKRFNLRSKTDLLVIFQYYYSLF